MVEALRNDRRLMVYLEQCESWLFFGALHREFTLFALPAIVVVHSTPVMNLRSDGSTIGP
jgi:hypothetical protein